MSTTPRNGNGSVSDADPVRKLIEALDWLGCKPTQRGDAWNARCPAHDDRSPSLAVSQGDDGRALVHCHAGCETEAVCGALGLTLSDLMPAGDSGRNGHRFGGHHNGSSSRPARDWTGEAERYFEHADAERKRRELTERLGVAVESLKELRAGWNGTAWTFPERNGTGQVIGIWTRKPADAPEGDLKRSLRGGKRGLTFAEDWNAGAGSVLIVEGASDTAAGLTMGLTVIGRPSAKGAAEHLGDLLRDVPSDRPIIVMGENDARQDGTWPGRDGAEHVARKLAESLRRPVQWALPPDKQKDLRTWMRANDRDGLRFVEALKPQTVEPAGVNGARSIPLPRRFSDIEPQTVRWLWPGRIPVGRISLLVGRPGEGKSFLTCDLAARISTGTNWPDGEPCEQGSVLFLTAEDGPADTIRPRLDAHGADVSEVSLLDDLDALARVRGLEEALQRMHRCRLVVIDPIGSFLGGRVDAHRDNEVRAVLAPLAEVAERTGAAVLIVAHTRKSTTEFADDAALGSRAFTGLARAVWHLRSDPENRERRLLLPGKNNLAEQPDGLAFEIAGDPPRLEWEDSPAEMHADDLLRAEAAVRKRGPAAEKREEAVELLRNMLSDGPRLAKDITEAAAAKGIAMKTLQRAKDHAEVESFRPEVPGKWWWRLPQGSHVGPKSEEPDDLDHLGGFPPESSRSVAGGGKVVKFPQEGSAESSVDDWGEV